VQLFIMGNPITLVPMDMPHFMTTNPLGCVVRVDEYKR
jgi:hypothetical protein